MDSRREVVIFSELHKNVMTNKIVMGWQYGGEGVNQYIKDSLENILTSPVFN